MWTRSENENINNLIKGDAIHEIRSFPLAFPLFRCIDVRYLHIFAVLIPHLPYVPEFDNFG